GARRWFAGCRGWRRRLEEGGDLWRGIRGRGSRGRAKLKLELADDLLDVGCSGRLGLERKVFPILLHCGRATIQILMRKDREVEQRGGIIGLRPQRRVELQAGLLVTAAVCLDQSLAVPCFGRGSVELERLVKTFFRVLE